MECADEVLSLREVHAGLAADGGVDLGQQRRRHLQTGDPPVVGGGGEPGGVADDAAAEGHDGVAPEETPGGEAATERLHRRQALGLLAVAHEEHLGHRAGPPEGGEQRFGVALGDRRLAHDRHPGPAADGGDGGPVEHARPHQDVVAAGAELDPDRAIGPSAHPAVQPVAMRTAVAVWPGERPEVSTRTWAAAR